MQFVTPNFTANLSVTFMKYFRSYSVLHADFAVATVLISFGAILGVASPLQLAVMATLEVLFYNLNILVGVHVIGVSNCSICSVACKILLVFFAITYFRQR